MSFIDELRRIALTEAADIIDSLPPMVLSPQVLAEAMRRHAKLGNGSVFLSILRTVALEDGVDLEETRTARPTRGTGRGKK